jgi:hypothetical protein
MREVYIEHGEYLKNKKSRRSEQLCSTASAYSLTGRPAVRPEYHLFSHPKEYDILLRADLRKSSQHSDCMPANLRIKDIVDMSVDWGVAKLCGISVIQNQLLQEAHSGVSTFCRGVTEGRPPMAG